MFTSQCSRPSLSHEIKWPVVLTFNLYMNTCSQVYMDGVFYEIKFSAMRGNLSESMDALPAYGEVMEWGGVGGQILYFQAAQ